MTLIQPAKLIIDLVDSICKTVIEPPAFGLTVEDEPPEPQPSWAVFGEEYCEMDNFALLEAHANLNDLMSEFDQYLATGSE